MLTSMPVPYQRNIQATIAKIKYEIYLFKDFLIYTSQYDNVSLIKVELNAIVW